jgi:hypothetical protein
LGGDGKNSNRGRPERGVCGGRFFDDLYEYDAKGSPANRIIYQVVRILFRSINEVPVAALQGEAVWDFSKTGDNVHDRPVNGAQIKCCEILLAVLI